MKRILTVLILLNLVTSSMTYGVFADTSTDYNSLSYTISESGLFWDNGESYIMSDTYIWVYKKINGVKYKRLYNETKKVWVGDWIRC